MNACLDWQIGDENGGWETISTMEKRTGSRTPRWTWYVLLALLAVLATAVAGGRFVLQYRYDRALNRATLQIQDAIDLEIQDFCGRWPGSTKFDPANMRGTIERTEDGQYLVRLDCTDHLDFWMEFTLA